MANVYLMVEGVAGSNVMRCLGDMAQLAQRATERVEIELLRPKRVEYRTQSVGFEELEKKLNQLAGDGWRYVDVDFVFQDRQEKGFEPGYAKWGTLILSREVDANR